MEKTSQQELSTIIAKTSTATPKAQTSSSTEPTCKTCSDTGWYLPTDSKRFTRCQCMIEKAIMATLPAKYIHARLSDFPRPLTDKLVAWLAAPGEGLFINGPAGSGKTHLCAGLIRARIQLGMPASFRRAADLYSAIRRSFGQSDDLTETSIMQGYCGVPLLVLDDIAAGSLSDYERRTALEVIDRRGNDLKPTVVTSNWTIAEIGEKMDERIASRLSAYQVIAFKGVDRRKAK